MAQLGRHATCLALGLAWWIVCGLAAAAQSGEPLPSWHDGATRQAIIDFVGRVTKDGGADFVPGTQRIAVFDNDGTLWCEKPIYVEAQFVVDRVKASRPSIRNGRRKSLLRLCSRAT